MSPEDGEWSEKNTAPLLHVPLSLLLPFLQPCGFLGPILPPRPVLSTPHCRAQPVTQRSGHFQDSLPEAAAFTMYGTSGQSALWPASTPHGPGRGHCPAWSQTVSFSCLLPTVLSLPHHRVPATAGRWGPGLRLLRQGSVGNQGASSDMNQREEGKVPACDQPD